jgi:FKBP-type peptidyl-prolyl cis-trans isomerase SlyD
MDKPANKFIAVTYQLYTDDSKEMVEEATVERPFQFITGMSLTLDAFEAELLKLEKDAEFDFQLNKEQAYGDYELAHVIDLDKQMFHVNGHFDSEHIYKDAVVPLQNEDGNRFYGKVLEITDDNVKMDLNHPLAGKTLHFTGKVLETREATQEEIQSLINQLSGGHQCGGDCGNCGGDCEGGDCDCEKDGCEKDGCEGGNCGNGGCGCH